MVVCMVPNDNKTRYDAIKKLCCLDEPVPSQVIRSQTLSKNVISVCTKVILQMNCKLGGSLWRVHIPMKTAMVVGYDAYHDSANRGKSVGAAVFSLDAGLTRWYSQCALHGESRELIGNLTQFCENGLKKYYEVNGFLPDRIFLYRDGCGDGQIPVVYSQELPQLQRAFRNIGQTMCVDYAPKLTFTIVTKRVNKVLRGQRGLHPQPSSRNSRGLRGDSEGTVRLLPRSPVCASRNRHSGVLQRHLRQQRTDSGSAAETGLQALSSLLQLARNHPSPSPLSVRSQAGLPRRTESSQTPASPLGRQTILLVIILWIPFFVRCCASLSSLFLLLFLFFDLLSSFGRAVQSCFVFFDLRKSIGN